MIDHAHHRERQVLGAISTGVALMALALVASQGLPAMDQPQVLVTCLLMGGAVLAYRFPIYLRHNTKLCVFSIPLLMLACTAPPLLAGTGTFVAVLAGELLVQKARGTLLGDVFTSSSRWSLLVAAASAVALLPLPFTEAPFVAAAAVLWVGDLLTVPLLLCPITGERPLRIVRTVFREGAALEAVQYAIGVLGVVLERQLPSAVVLFVVPGILIYVVFRKHVDHDTMALLETAADNVELRDPYLDGHAERVTEHVRAILNYLGMHGQEAEQVLIAARLHDLGKVHLNDELVLKSEALTPEEHASIRAYPAHTARLLAAYPDLSRCLDMVRHHHEAWDGSGYPAGLKGTDIPFGARVIAVADAFDAMTHDRPHRRALTHDQALQILCDGSGRQWDPGIVNVFLRTFNAETQVTESITVERVPEPGLLASTQVIA